MKKTRVAILFLLLTLFAACLPAAAELPAQVTKPCQNADRIHKLIGYVAFVNRHCGLYKCTHCGREGVYYTPYEEHSGGTETPTCTTGKTCALCGAEYGILGHDWSTWTSNGDGTHTRSCKRSNCDAVENESCSGGTGTFTCTKGKTCEKCGAEYGILGHDWGAWTPIYDGTYTHTRRCTRCNAEETGSCSGGYADCTSLGMCSTCGGSYYGGHVWGEWSSAGNGTHIRNCKNCYQVDTASCTGGTATCSAKAVCVECGGEYGDLGHDWGAWTSNGDGAHTRSCTRCNAEETESCSGGTGTFTCITGKICEKCGAEYGILGHDWGKWKPIRNMNMHLKICNRCNRHETAYCTGGTATCSAEAVCVECGGAYGEKDSNNHDLVQYAAKAPTCTEIGWDAYDRCIRCGYTTRKELPAQHDLEQHAAKAPTCTGPGWDAYETCSRCDHTTYAELPALNHALVQHAAQAPTCTGIGWNAYKTCSRCDHTTYVELPALNHDLVHHEAKAATCTEIGWNAYDTCSRCDYTTYQELPILGHDYQAVIVEPTCETDGYTLFTCSRCKDSYTANPTDKLGHQFDAWSPNETGSQSAGCLRDGCANINETDCRKFNFRTAGGEALTFCPVCGQAESGEQLEKLEAATAWALSGSLSAADVTVRTNGEYLSVAFESAGSLTQPTGLVRLALPAKLLEGKKLVRIAPDGTQTELPFETKDGKIIFTLDFANSELPVMLFRLVPQTTTL